MTTEQQSKEEVAVATMYKEAFLPAFFEKLASLGVDVQTEADAQELLKVADMLAQADAIKPQAQGMHDRAEAIDPLLKVASAALQAQIARTTPSNALLDAAVALV